MKPEKIQKKDAKLIDLGGKRIYAYPLQTKMMSVAYMVVKGRNPTKKNTFLLEHDCQFIIYVTKGKGRIYTSNELFEVTVGDVVYIPTDNKFAVEGDMEYVTVDTPGYYPEQSTEIEVI
jgi:mannose-6-phosphate isomerase-like protein (cupin superfamily)